MYDLNYKTSNNKRLHVEIALTQLSTLTGGLPTTNDAEPVTASSESKPVYQTPKPVPQQAAKSETQPSVVSEKARPPAPQQQQTAQVANENETPDVREKPEAPSEVPKAKVPAEKPVEENTTQPQPATSPSPRKTKVTTSRPSGHGHTIRNISIKDTLNALKTKNEQASDEPEPIIINEFTQETLEQAWHKFVESFKEKSPNFVLTLSKGHPVLKENFNIEYHVPNIIIKDDKLNINILLDYLKKELNNNQIKLEAIVDKHAQQKEAYTDRERFEKLSKEYPKLTKLKNELDMELGF